MPRCPFCGRYLPAIDWSGRCPCGEDLPENLNEYFRERCPFMKKFPYSVDYSESNDLIDHLERLGR